MTKSAISWHPADIRAAVAKRGSSLSRIAQEAGLHANTGQLVLREPCYPAEQAIAAFLGVPAQEIWPNRYDSEGLTKQPRIRKQLIAEKASVKCQKQVAA